MGIRIEFMGRAALCVLCSAAAGCGTSATDGGAGNQDLTGVMASTDMAGGGNSDMPGGGSDMAGATVDMAQNALSLEIGWTLYDKKLINGSTQGFQEACDFNAMKPTTSLSFTVENTKTKATKVTPGIPCPSKATTGTAVVGLPDSTGPFNIHAVAVGRAESASERLCNLAAGMSGNLWIYLGGCDDAKCKACP